MKITDMGKCSGCGACFAICPKQAISLKEDEYARKIPEINNEKCVECALCVKVCPIDHDDFTIKGQYKQVCYAAQGKPSENIEGSSSGGIATILSRYIIERHGIVFGSKFDSELNLIHIGAKNNQEIDNFKGSKYVQSDMSCCYREIKEEIRQKRKALVIGTPCQIAGLKGYLGKEDENLYLVDLVCHGTPPIKYLKEYVEKFGKIDNVGFREKTGFFFSLYKDGEKIHSMSAPGDEYFKSFLEGITYRENCYSCPYACLEREGDITIGDFWGLNKRSLKYQYEGNISVMLINSKKGEELLNKVRDNLIMEERSIEEAIRENQQLQHPMEPDREDRKRFIMNYPKLGFCKAIKKTQLYKREIRWERMRYCLLEKRIGRVAQTMWHCCKKILRGVK